MTNYYRITGYYPQDNFCFIMDSFGLFEKLWEFSSCLIQKGMKIIEVSTDEKFLDVNIAKADEDNEHFILRATAEGKPKYIEQVVNGVKYKAIQVADKIYIPDKEKTI